MLRYAIGLSFLWCFVEWDTTWAFLSGHVFGLLCFLMFTHSGSGIKSMGTRNRMRRKKVLDLGMKIMCTL